MSRSNDCLRHCRRAGLCMLLLGAPARKSLRRLGCGHAPSLPILATLCGQPSRGTGGKVRNRTCRVIGPALTSNA